MSDPLRTDSSREPHAATEADRDAKIEQLLLAGLDHYFAGHYEHAIKVWTRALFLDRSHARARAYIERARSALAERQRQSEELLHSGVAAFERGEGHEARRLLDAAIASGAPRDEAMVLLDRLNRLHVPASLPAVRERPRDVREPASRADPPAADRRPGLRALTALGAVLIVVAGGISAAAIWDRLQLRSLIVAGDQAGAGRTPPVVRDAVLPLPRRGEIAIVRARALAAAGHLYDALAALDQIRPTDSEKGAADRLRTSIQRELLDPGSARRP